MLLEQETRNLTSSGVMEVARATIKTSPKIFNFFEKQTYSNVPRTICRELVANGWDSHQMAGKGDVPVQVWLPTMLDPTFRVRDFGLGMSHEFMMTSFMAYADGSTKDGSNLAIGGFGIGSKSPFAHVDQYNLRSIFNGVESVYSIFKDEEGIPSIGLLGQRATTEPNGVTVEFPVQPDDFQTFEDAAFEALRYFEPLPDIRNATVGKFAPPEYVSRGASWGMREKPGPMQIIMGGVMYPVNVDNLTYKFNREDAAYKLLKYGLDLRLPIGACHVALSREALSYDDHTINAIREACEGVIDEVAASFATMFDKHETEWSAACALHAEVGDSGTGERASFLKEHALWRGQPLDIVMKYPTTSTYRHKDEVLQRTGYQAWLIDSNWERRGRGGSSKPVGSAKFESPGIGFVPGKIGHLIIDDLPQKPKHKAIRKIKEFVSENGTRKTLVIRPNEWLEDDAPTAEQIAKVFGCPADQLVLTSSLPEPYMERSSRGKMANRPKVRMFTFDGSTIRSSRRYGYSNNINPGPHGKDGVREIAYVEQPTSGVLVVMDKFEIPRSEIQQLVNAGLLRWDELHFVNEGDAKKLNKQNWVGFAALAERRKKEKLSAYPELAQRLAISNTQELRWLFERFRHNPTRDFTSRKPLGKIFKLYKTYVEPLDEAQRKLAQYVTAKLPRGVKPEELRDQFKAKQPRANRLIQLLPAHLDDEDFGLLQENL